MVLPKQLQEPTWIWSALILVFIVVVGCSGSAFMYYQINTSEMSDASGRAAMLAQTLNVDDVYRLSGTRDDQKSPVYQRMKVLLQKIRDSDSSIKDVRILGIDDTARMFTYVDSEDTSSLAYSGPGWTYKDASRDVALSVFRTTNGISSLHSDTDGTWIIGYAPIVSRTGMVVAVAALKLDASSYIYTVLSFVSVPLLGMLMGLIIIAGFQAQRRKEYRFLAKRMELLSIASHEIRTPLTGMRWVWDGYLKDHEATLTPADKEILARANQSCVAVIARIGEILASQSDGQGDNLKLVALPMKPLFEQIVQSLSLAAQSRSVTFVIDPSVTPETTIRADHEQIYNIFFNLATNAIKYTREHTNIVFAYVRRDTHDIFTVTDGGEGIKPEEIAHIFDGYYRTDRAKKSGQEGTGLGLFLVKKAVELHGGTITVKSEEGKGTTFEIAFPVAKPQTGVLALVNTVKERLEKKI